MALINEAFKIVAILQWITKNANAGFGIAVVDGTLFVLVAFVVLVTVQVCTR